MCRAVLIASDRPLPLVAFNEASPAFHVSEAAPPCPRFTLPHQYYAGAHTGCGCGFDVSGHIAVEEGPATASSRAALAAYLEAQLARGCKLEVLTGLDGDEEGPFAHSGECTVSRLLEHVTGDWDRDFFTLIR